MQPQQLVEDRIDGESDVGYGAFAVNTVLLTVPHLHKQHLQKREENKQHDSIQTHKRMTTDNTN